MLREKRNYKYFWVVMFMIVASGLCSSILIAQGRVNSTENTVNPLIESSLLGNIAEVRKLLEADADVNAKGRNDNTALHMASQNGHTEIVRLLLEAYAEVNAKGRDFNTALHMASRIGNAEIVKLLLEAGADVDAKGKDDSTALHIASEEGLSEIVKLLKEYSRKQIRKAAEQGYTPVQAEKATTSPIPPGPIVPPPQAVLERRSTIAANSQAIKPKSDFDLIFDDASLNFRQGQYEKAIELYKKANRLKENTNLECLWGLAQAYDKLGAYKNAQRTCEKLIEACGDNLSYRARAWNLIGNTLSNNAMKNPDKPDLKKLREAEQAYREVLLVSSGAQMAHYNLGITLIRMNRIPEGIEEMRACIQPDGDEGIAEKARKTIEDPRRAVFDFSPDFSLVTSDGEYFTSDELHGKVVLLDFWGAWCPPCVRAIPDLKRLAKKYSGEEFFLVSIDVNDPKEKWLEFLEENKMNWPQVRDGRSTLVRAFQVTVFPTYILIDHDGIIRQRMLGGGSEAYSNISSEVKKALKNLEKSVVVGLQRNGRNSGPIDAETLDRIRKIAEQGDTQVRVEMPIDIPQDLSIPIGNVFAPPNNSTSFGPGSGGGIGSGEGIYVMGMGAEGPQLIRDPLPSYTEEAREARIEGKVILTGVVRKNGLVDSIQVVRGLGYGLDESAIRTITTKWRFRPATYKGKPVDHQIDIEVEFLIHKKKMKQLVPVN